MQMFVTLLHVLLCLFLILIILLQPGKEGAAALGGGGANQSYGPRGQAHALGRATAIVAVLFMFTSITLAYWSNQSIREGSDIDDDTIRSMEEEEAASTGAVSPDPEPAEPAPAQALPPASEDATAPQAGDAEAAPEGEAPSGTREGEAQ